MSLKGFMYGFNHTVCVTLCITKYLSTERKFFCIAGFEFKNQTSKHVVGELYLIRGNVKQFVFFHLLFFIVAEIRNSKRNFVCVQLNCHLTCKILHDAHHEKYRSQQKN